jgi:hypothetical protein
MYLKLRKLLIGDEKIKVIGSKKNNLKKNGKILFVRKFIKRVPKCSKFQAEQLLFYKYF